MLTHAPLRQHMCTKVCPSHNTLVDAESELHDTDAVAGNKEHSST